MTYEFRVERAPTYLHVRGSGDHTADNMQRFLREAYRAAIENDRDCLLMELNFAGPSLNLGSVYLHAALRFPHLLEQNLQPRCNLLLPGPIRHAREEIDLIADGGVFTPARPRATVAVAARESLRLSVRQLAVDQRFANGAIDLGRIEPHVRHGRRGQRRYRRRHFGELSS